MPLLNLPKGLRDFLKSRKAQAKPSSKPSGKISTRPIKGGVKLAVVRPKKSKK